jgi:hypothetical protein
MLFRHLLMFQLRSQTPPNYQKLQANSMQGSLARDPQLHLSRVALLEDPGLREQLMLTLLASRCQQSSLR